MVWCVVEQFGCKRVNEVMNYWFGFINEITVAQKEPLQHTVE